MQSDFHARLDIYIVALGDIVKLCDSCKSLQCEFHHEGANSEPRVAHHCPVPLS